MWIRSAAVAASLVALTPGVAGATPVVPSPDVVIQAGFGGGGNTGPTSYYPRDFVELFNRGGTAVTLAGWSLQYVPPSTGTAAWNFALPTTTLQAGQTFLVLGNAGGTATAGTLPASDSATAPPDIKRDTWTIYLTRSTTAIIGDTDPTIVDELGVGTTLGTTPRAAAGQPAPAVSNTTAAVRNGGGCANTNNNAADFTVVTTDASFPIRNSASALTPCAAAVPASLPELPVVPLLAVAGVGVALVARRRLA